MSYDISVVVLTYNPKIEELKLTLRSILLQEGVSIEIITADDGSSQSPADDIKSFLSASGLTDYKLVMNPENQGTVKNVLSGVNAASGRFIKLISPGDYLYGKDVLKKMYDHAISSDSQFVFGDVIFFDSNREGINPVPHYSYPQFTDVFDKGADISRLKTNYILANDVVNGAATLVDRDLMAKYLNMIAGKVIFCEDMIYRLMINDGIRPTYLPSDILLYGYGTGVSSSSSKKWEERMHKDFREANKIIMASDSCSSSFARKLEKVEKALECSSGLKKMLIYFFTSPAIVRVKMSIKKSKRTTTVSVDNTYVEELFSYVKINE